ncbi:MAG: LanC-like protein [Proteobacteria bacterium]|nr:LanC-like protein [Pseudomonadota bacterium]
MTVLYDPARHEPLQARPWDADLARDTIRHIVRDTEDRFSADRYWPLHPRDANGDEGPDPVATPLYYGAAGVIWALHYLQAVGATRLSRSYFDDLERLLASNRAWLHAAGSQDHASYLMGDTPIELMAYGNRPDAARADRLAALIAGNVDHPTRELMWGSPGTLLAALFLHERDGDARWADLFRQTAAKLWSQLLWSNEQECHYWTQDLYGIESTYLDAVHGFVATALPLVRGRHLLRASEWGAWRACIVNTIRKTATQHGDQANWPTQLIRPEDRPSRALMQYCHGAPGFVVCLGDFPGDDLDDLLLAGGRAVWAAGPLTKGSNLCHGTGGNGYAFLKLYQRTQDPRWLERARAFAMHGIAQTQADAVLHGQMRYSLWTGDPGFAIYLWDCMRGEASFPTLDVFYA